MRVILFRGKDFSGVINHRWCFGSLDTTEKDRAVIIYLDRFGNKCRVFVNPDTVGQYTGLTDKNGTKIFEGDIVKREYTLWHGEAKKTRETQIGVVSYSNKDCGFCLDKVCNLRKPWDGDTLEIIGNIHDSPEKLKIGATAAKF